MIACTSPAGSSSESPFRMVLPAMEALRLRMESIESDLLSSFMAGRKSRPPKNADLRHGRAERGHSQLSVHGSPGVTPGDNREVGEVSHGNGLRNSSRLPKGS